MGGGGGQAAQGMALQRQVGTMVSVKLRKHLCFCEGSGCSDEIFTGLPLLHCWLMF